MAYSISAGYLWVHPCKVIELSAMSALMQRFCSPTSVSLLSMFITGTQAGAEKGYIMKTMCLCSYTQRIWQGCSMPRMAELQCVQKRFSVRLLVITT